LTESGRRLPETAAKRQGLALIDVKLNQYLAVQAFN